MAIFYLWSGFKQVYQLIDEERYLVLLTNILWPHLKLFGSSSAILVSTRWSNMTMHKKISNISLSRILWGVISCRSEFTWPAHGPDFSPYDYWIWSEVEYKVNCQNQSAYKPWKTSSHKLQMKYQPIRNDEYIVASFCRRVQFWYHDNGSLFESEMSP